MGNKIITEKDFWRCTSGLVPVPLQNNGGIAKKESGETFITKKDKATSATMDFSCKWIMLIMAIIVAIVAVAIVATGGGALGAIVAAGAMAGAEGAALGAAIAFCPPLGGLVCGQRAAIARTWDSFKSNFMVQKQEVITGKDMMTCALFGDKITFAPEIKNWAQAYAEGGANFIGGVLEGMLAGAGIGMLGAGAAAIKAGTLTLSSVSSAISMNSLRVLGNNVARNWLSTVGLQTGVRGLQWAAKPVIAMAVGLRGAMGLEGGLRSYSQDESVDLSDVGSGLVGMETGTVHSAENIYGHATGGVDEKGEPIKSTWHDYVGMALWFMPIHANNDKGKNRTTPEEVKNETTPEEIKNESTEQTNNAEVKAKETKGEFDAYEESSIKLRIKDMKDAMTEGEVGRTTYSVAKVKLKNGKIEHWVSSAGKKGYVPPRIRKAAGTETVSKNKSLEGNSKNRFNDAEQTILREAKEKGAQVEDIGATRDMCHRCQEVFKKEGLIEKVSTPLKK